MRSLLDRLETAGDRAGDLADDFNDGIVDAVARLAWWTDGSAAAPFQAVGRVLVAVVQVLFGVVRVSVFYLPAVVLGVGGALSKNVPLVVGAIVYGLVITAAGLTYVLRREPDEDG